MDWIDYTFILLAYIIAAGIKGLTGVGFSTSCLSILVLRLDLKIAIPLVIIPSIVSNVAVMIQAGHFHAALRRFWLFYIAVIPGLVVGLSILVVVNVGVAKALLGFILITYTIWALSNTSFSLSKKWERNLKIPAGFLTGFVNGLTGSQVMPSLPYLLSLDIGKNLFVQAINISFTLSSLVMLVGMRYWGVFTGLDVSACRRWHCSGFNCVVFFREIAGKAYGKISSAVGVGIFVGNRFDFDA